MVRAFVLYESEPDPERYEQHVELCRQVPGSDLPAREGLRRADGRAAVRLLRRVGVSRPRGVQGGCAKRGVHGDRQGRDGDGRRASTCSSRRSRERARARGSAAASAGASSASSGSSTRRRRRGPRSRSTGPRSSTPSTSRMLRELARACEDASWDDEIRVVVLTGAGRAFCVGADLQLVGGRLPRQADRVLEVVRRVQGRARPAARDRQADARADQRDRGRRRERAPDGVRPRGDGRRRLHPARRARARLGARRRRDAVADDHGRRPAGARDRADVRGDAGRARPRSGASSTGLCPLPSSTRRWTRWSRTSRGSCRRRRATRSSTSTSGATSRGTRRSTTRATGSRSRWRPRSRGRRSRSFLERK